MLLTGNSLQLERLGCDLSHGDLVVTCALEDVQVRWSLPAPPKRKSKLLQNVAQVFKILRSS